MEHRNENEIICPYCGWEDQDSWEFTEESGTDTCASCDKEFNVFREVSVTYSTSRIDCEENKTQHEYQFESVFMSKRDYKNGIWTDLPEDKWQYTKIMICSICDDKEYIDITKDEYYSTTGKSLK